MHRPVCAWHTLCVSCAHGVVLGHVVVHAEHVPPLYTHDGFSWHAVWLLEYVLHAVDAPVPNSQPTHATAQTAKRTQIEALAVEVVVHAARRE